MNDSPAEDWTHTAIIVALPPEGVARSVIGALQVAAETVLASPEFDEVSLHLALETPGNPHPTSPALGAILLNVLEETEASTITLVWCGHGGEADARLDRDLDSLHAVRTESALAAALRAGAVTLNIAVRDVVIDALEAAEGSTGMTRVLIEAALPVYQVSPGHVLPRLDESVPAPSEESSAVLSGVLDPALRMFRSETESSVANGRSDLPLALDDLPDTVRSPVVAAESPTAAGLAAVTHEDAAGLDANPLLPDAVEEGASEWDAPPDGGVAIDDQGEQWHPAPQYSRTNERSPAWLPPAVQNVVTSLTSQVDDWRTGRTKVRRAEERVGVAEFEQLPVFPGVRRPLIYFAMAASTEWDKQAVRTRDAALTLITRALNRQWVAVAVNLGASLSRIAGPTAPELVAQEWRRIDRSNEFDLGSAAAELSGQLSRDIASLRLRGHEVGAPHIVVFATEPPYVDSSAHNAYQELLAGARSVTWLLVGNSDWMEIPPELEEPPSRVLHAEQDGTAIFLAEVLAPAEQQGDEWSPA